jgi:hypothetical protein
MADPLSFDFGGDPVNPHTVGPTGLPPISGKTPISRHASFTGAREAVHGRGEKQKTYAQILRNHGPMSDQDVAALTRWPLSSVNSIRCSFGDQIVACGLEPSPFGRAKRTTWGFLRAKDRNNAV